jgi:hypothetical protein
VPKSYSGCPSKVVHQNLLLLRLSKNNILIEKSSPSALGKRFYYTTRYRAGFMTPPVPTLHSNTEIRNAHNRVAFSIAGEKKKQSNPITPRSRR